jgi:hypothetical protein
LPKENKSLLLPLMEKEGIQPVEPAHASTGNHAEENIIQGSPGASGKAWGISKGIKQGPDPCPRCAPQVDEFGGNL